MNYTENIKIISSVNGIDKNDIFIIENLENSDLYEEFFEYFYNEINLNSKRYKIKPAYFYIDNNRNCGAAALFKDGNYFIKISCGYVEYMNLMLRSENNIFKDKDVSILYNSIKNEVTFNFQDFILKASMIFTFHHEFRHLLQCDGKEFKFSENQKDDKFSFERHLFEYDADLIGAWYVMDFAVTTFDSFEIKSKENVVKLMCLALSSIIITYLLFYFNRMEKQMVLHNPENFYSEKNTHPHTIVRILSIIEFYKVNVQKNYNLNIELTDFFKYSLEISNLYFEGLNLNKDFNLVESFFKILENNIYEVNNYVTKLDQETRKHSKIKELMSNYTVI